MQKNKKIRTVYNFRNTCQKCFNDVEFPLLGDFSYGELIFQTTDGKDFSIAEIVKNEAFDFIRETINDSEELTASNVKPEKILALLEMVQFSRTRNSNNFDTIWNREKTSG
ncbi:hypothetical protein ACX0G7_27290, partial [Flavitalea antarctica]